MRKIVTYLIRQSSDEDCFEELKSLSFFKFLHSVGMFYSQKAFEDFTVEEKLEARSRYMYALSATIKGAAKVFFGASKPKSPYLQLVPESPPSSSSSPLTDKLWFSVCPG